MTTQIMQRLAGVLGLFVVSAAATCHTDADGSRAYHGCEVYEQSYFSDGELELVHEEPVECPVPIYTVGQTVNSAGDLYDYRQKWLKGEHQVYRSTDRFVPIADDSELFREISATARVSRLFVSYKAATGRGYIGDFDYGNFTATSGILQAFLGLKYTTRSPQAVRSTLSGTRNPYSGTWNTWTASGSGGVEPYRMEWYRSGTLVGKGTSYSGSAGDADFPLRVDIHDAYGRTASGYMQVDVDGVLASYAGPTDVSSTEPATWTASHSGGYGPYRYDWYEDGTWVGEGPSYTGSGYTAWTTFRLRMQVTDTRGSTHGFTQLISVSPTEGCDVSAC